MKNALIFLSLLFIVLGSCKKTESEEEALDAFLSESSTTTYTTIQEGLYHVQHIVGTGESPTDSTTIKAKYTGSYIDGEVFDAGEGHKVYIKGSDITE